MSTALVAALRESRGYLRDDGYHQTARLMAAAAHEIERLNGRVYALESRGERAASCHRTSMSENPASGRAVVNPRRHHG